MKYLDAGTGTRVNKIFKGWDDIMKEFGFSQSSASMVLLDLAEALVKRWERRQILMLVDEIFVCLSLRETLGAMLREPNPSSLTLARMKKRWRRR